MDKKYTIFAGVNGAGKSTLYAVTKDDSLAKNRINSDEILRENSGNWRSLKDQSLAMKEAVRRINSYLGQGVSFNQETTLTGRSIINNILKAKKQGYVIDIHYVGVENADIAIERVHTRVKRGGHGIAEDDIRRRYTESLNNLVKVIPLCDKVMVYDNTKEFERIAMFRAGKLIMVNNNCKWFSTHVLKTFRSLAENMTLER